MTYRRHNLRVRTRNAVQWVLDNRVDPTDITVAGESGSYNSTTDAVFFDKNYTNYCNLPWWPFAGLPAGVIALAECRSLHLSTNRCESFHVHFDTSFFNGKPAAYHRDSACHEIGHTLGLEHRPDTPPNSPDKGCMTAGIDTSGADLRNNYTQHDIAHINSNY